MIRIEVTLLVYRKSQYICLQILPHQKGIKRLYIIHSPTIGYQKDRIEDSTLTMSIIKDKQKKSRTSGMSTLFAIITILEVDVEEDVILTITGLVAKGFTIARVMVENYYFHYQRYYKC